MPVSLRHPVRHLHPRQRAALAGIPLADVKVIVGRAHLNQNLMGGILSGHIHNAAADYRRLQGDVHTMQAQDRATNRSAMQSCCSACRETVARMPV